MRIQHNIMAMNAYRNYNTNTSALSKNLEKLSSGYKINRAGDDAAGLAISEKMRAQITGLNAAQKNVKDGISLVKTAEGAMQEIQDMLNRMDYLATQSANGTYDNEVDRLNLQKEVDQLKSEIDRIADSANFNGIKLLDGSLDANSKTSNTTTTFNGQADMNLQHVMVTDPRPNDPSDDDMARYHKDATGASKTSFEINLDRVNTTTTANTTVEGLKFGLAGKLSDGTTVNVLKGADSNDITYDLEIGDTGEVTSKDVAKAIYDAIGTQDTSGKHTVKLQLPSAAAGGANTEVEYKVTLDGDKLKFEMTDAGFATAAADANKDTPVAANAFQGHFNFAAVMPGSLTEPTFADAGNPTDEELAAKATYDAAKAVSDAFGFIQESATSNVKHGSATAGVQYAETVLAYDSAKNADLAIKDGAGLMIGNEKYVWATTDETANAEYADGVKVVDLRDLDIDKDGATWAADPKKVTEALARLTEAAKGNEMFSVQLNNIGSALVFTERSTNPSDADLTTKEGLQAQFQTFSSVSTKTTVEKEAGTALTLQIGDTSDSYNQLKVSVGDMHTSALKIADLDISNPESASTAIQTIKDAINYVSGIRGDLGATQNRLEHTANNLSVMAENIQDAESTIRDTDVAEEMMAYTKNNILIQSAQAMLAQANAVPQGVLQLLG